MIDAELYLFHTIFQFQSMKIGLFTFSLGLRSKGSGNLKTHGKQQTDYFESLNKVALCRHCYQIKFHLIVIHI